MLENVKVAQIKKFNSALLLHYFCTTSALLHHSSPAFALFHFCTFQFLHFFTFALLHLAYIFSKWINWKSIFPKCIFPKCISAKCTQLACLLSFASLFLYFLWPWLLLWPSYNLDLVPFRDYYYVHLIIRSLLVIISSLFSSPPWVPGQIMPPVRLYLPHWEDSQHASYFLFSQLLFTRC